MDNKWQYKNLAEEKADCARGKEAGKIAYDLGPQGIHGLLMAVSAALRARATPKKTAPPSLDTEQQKVMKSLSTSLDELIRPLEPKIKKKAKK